MSIKEKYDQCKQECEELRKKINEKRGEEEDNHCNNNILFFLCVFSLIIK